MEDLLNWHRDCAATQIDLANLWCGRGVQELENYYRKSASKHLRTADAIEGLMRALKKADETASIRACNERTVTYAVTNLERMKERMRDQGWYDELSRIEFIINAIKSDFQN